jgi:hypothetical protein
MTVRDSSHAVSAPGDGDERTGGSISRRNYFLNVHGEGSKSENTDGHAPT